MLQAYIELHATCNCQTILNLAELFYPVLLSNVLVTRAHLSWKTCPQVTNQIHVGHAAIVFNYVLLFSLRLLLQLSSPLSIQLPLFFPWPQGGSSVHSKVRQLQHPSVLPSLPPFCPSLYNKLQLLLLIMSRWTFVEIVKDYTIILSKTNCKV